MLPVATTLRPLTIRDRRLLASGISGIVARVLGILAGAVSLAIMARSVSEVAFGVVGTLTALLAYVSFMDLGIGSAAMSHLAALDGSGRTHQVQGVLAHAFRRLVTIGMAIGLVSLTAVFLLPVHRLLGAGTIPEPDVKLAILSLTTSIAIGVPASLGSRAQVGLQQGSTDNAWFLGGALASAGMVAVVAWLDGGLWAYVLAMAGVRTLISAVQTVSVLRGHGVRLRMTQADAVEGSTARDLARLGRLFFVLQGAVVIAYQSDAIVVSSIAGAATAGSFVVAMRMFTPISNVISGATQQLWTASAEALARGDIAWVRSRFARSILLSMGLAAVSSSALLLVADPLARWWVGDAFVPDRSLMVVFAIWTVYSVGMGQVGYLLNASAIVRPQVVMAGAMTSLNLLLSILFTHWWGIAGPLWGSLIAHVATTAGPALFLAAKIVKNGGRRETLPRSDVA